MVRRWWNTAYYLSKYVGKYRVKSAIDEVTHDFPRDYDGKIEPFNVYIKCNNSIQITHYGQRTLQCYVPSIGRGHNILKKIAVDSGFDLNTYGNPFDYEKMYEDLSSLKFVFNIFETDEEIIWRFKDKDIEKMFKYITPQTSGANISPFSPRNLPKKKYEIDKEQINAYKEIINSKELENKLVIGLITTRFIKDFIPKTQAIYRNKNMDAVMKQSQLSGKEFIHSIGMWDEYLKYLKQEINNKKLEDENA